MRPIIGITVVAEPDPSNERSGGKLSLNYNYAQVVADAGGIPVLIPPQADPQLMLDIIDGWLIPGGLDIDAKEYGQENHSKNEVVQPERYNLEKALYRSAPHDLPILGICYGCQFLNVMQGGTLIQHVPDVLAENAEHSEGTLQQYSVVADSKLGRMVGGQASGKSYHHQAVNELGEDLVVTARSNDGIIEGLEMPSRPFVVAVQWHPERTPENKNSQDILKHFIMEARKYKHSKTKSKEKASV